MRRPGRGASPLPVLLRPLLLVVVVAGLLGMHVLAGGHGSAEHGSGLRVTATASASHPHAAAQHGTTSPLAAPSGAPVPLEHVVAGGQDADDAPPGTVECFLFLAAAGLALLAALRRVALRPAAFVLVVPGSVWRPSLRHRGPPPWAWPRFALCVLRT
ncbi:hypothetical protein [Kineococcus xinjiangensis]|uniref:hypothetical protein n=1 Tax=Kineococcus xinjiangensis TaxID=512762 RepID=UPI0011B0A7D2|nr:hypothetical protein [Kineococcus xinjiangensis]